MNTLEKKGFLDRKKIGLVYFYNPRKLRDEAVKGEVSNMLYKMFNGSVSTLANHLINSDNLSLGEVEAIKDLLNQKEKELRREKS